MPTKRRIPSRNYYLSSQFKLNDKKYYKCSCETAFKKRFANHKKSFNNERHKNEMELSKKLGDLKSTNNSADVARKIVRRCAPVDRAIQKCSLCLKEKLEIATY